MTYVPTLPPRAKQVEALRELEGRDEFALLMAMRTGKTKVVLDDFGRLEDAGEIQDLLVIAPAGVYRTWLGQVETHVGLSLLSRLLVRVWSASDGAKAEREMRAFMVPRDGVPRLLLVNVEALSSVRRARELCLDFVGQRGCMIAIDESTAIKSHKAERSKFCVRLGLHARKRRIMTGLLTPTSPLDSFMQFEALRPGILGFSNPYTFKARYAIQKRIPVGGRSVDVVVGWRDTKELAARIAQHSFRCELKDCYDLPAKTFEPRHVEMTAEQRRIYGEIKAYATAQLSQTEHVTATIVITQLLRLHQVLCGHVTDENGVLHAIPERRTAALIDLLEGHDGKSIVWCSYGHDVVKVSGAIADAFSQPDPRTGKPVPAPVARFWGGNRPTREDEERMFLTDPACRWMVATPGAGGRGRTWTIADLVVYYSNTDNLEHRSQSEERTQGVDKMRSDLFVDLLVPGTVDEKIIKALRGKINMAATISGDDWREWIV